MLWTRSKPSDKGKGNVIHPMVLRLSSHQSQWTLPFPSSGTGWNRTCNFTCYTTYHHVFEFCHINTYFLFQSKYYEQIHSSSMGSPISLIVAKMLMEEVEIKPINTAPLYPGCGTDLWMTPFHPKGRTQQTIPATHHVH